MSEDNVNHVFTVSGSKAVMDALIEVLNAGRAAVSDQFAKEPDPTGVDERWSSAVCDLGIATNAPHSENGDERHPDPLLGWLWDATHLEVGDGSDLPIYEDERDEPIPNIEVFHVGVREFVEAEQGTWQYDFVLEHAKTSKFSNLTNCGPLEGWFWWSCSPGCLPEGEPNGPFKTKVLAEADSQTK